MTELLLLKWGTLKGYRNLSERGQEIAARYDALGTSISAMAQRDTLEQKQLLCELIDAIDGEIINDWSGETLTKDEAKTYVLEYGREGR